MMVPGAEMCVRPRGAVHRFARTGRGCLPGGRLGVCALHADPTEGKDGDTLCVLLVNWYGARKGVRAGAF